MSKGALTQLVAIGAQDSNFLTCDTTKSIFQEKEKKITNFVRSTSSMIPIGNSNWGSTIKFNIERRGDLLSSLYLVVELPEVNASHIGDKLKCTTGSLNQTGDLHFKWADYIGNVIVENVKLYFNGQLIDEQTGEFQQIYTDLYDDDWNKLCMIGNNPSKS